MPILKFYLKYASALTLINGMAIKTCMLIKVMMNKATLGNPLIFASINRIAGKKNIGPILKVLATMYQKHPCVTFCLIKARVQSTFGSETNISLNRESTAHTMHEN